MDTSRATTEGANDPFDARTKRRLVGCAVGVPLLVFVWIVGTWWAMDQRLLLRVTNRSGTPVERVLLVHGKGDETRYLDSLTGTSGFWLRLDEPDLEAVALRFEHSGGSFDVDVAHVLEPTPFLRVEVVVTTLDHKGVAVSSRVERGQLWRRLTFW